MSAISYAFKNVLNGSLDVQIYSAVRSDGVFSNFHFIYMETETQRYLFVSDHTPRKSLSWVWLEPENLKSLRFVLYSAALWCLLDIH